jgi:hypothetical protein
MSKLPNKKYLSAYMDLRKIGVKPMDADEFLIKNAKRLRL